MSVGSRRNFVAIEEEVVVVWWGWWRGLRGWLGWRGWWGGRCGGGGGAGGRGVQLWGSLQILIFGDCSDFVNHSIPL